jgi:hypothetical protein
VGVIGIVYEQIDRRHAFKQRRKQAAGRTQVERPAVPQDGRDGETDLVLLASKRQVAGLEFAPFCSRAYRITAVKTQWLLWPLRRPPADEAG